MQFHKIGLILLFASMHHVHGGVVQADVLSFGDFMEYTLSVQSSCSHLSDAEDVITFVTSQFDQCIKRIIGTAASGMFGDLKLICENQDTYLQCWDHLNQDITTNCGQSENLPAVYAATVKTFCGHDNGNLTISNLKSTFKLMFEEILAGVQACPPETRTSWMETCMSSLEVMISRDVCERLDALDQCLENVVCTKFQMGRLEQQLYGGGRTYLNCSYSY